jgi:hypothetical protein
VGLWSCCHFSIRHFPPCRTRGCACSVAFGTELPCLLGTGNSFLCAWTDSNDIRGSESSEQSRLDFVSYMYWAAFVEDV